MIKYNTVNALAKLVRKVSNKLKKNKNSNVLVWNI